MVRPTLPTEVKDRRGTLRKDRIRGDLVPIAFAGIDAPPPDSLREAGIAEWKHTLETCPWVAISDLTALRLLCEAVDRRDDLVREYEKDGTMVVMETSTGYPYVNPVLGAIDKIEDRITKWMSLLGKTPSDRSRLGVAEVKQASVLDRLSAERASRAGRPGGTPSSPRQPASRATASAS